MSTQSIPKPCPSVTLDQAVSCALLAEARLAKVREAMVFFNIPVISDHIIAIVDGK